MITDDAKVFSDLLEKRAAKYSERPESTFAKLYVVLRLYLPSNLLSTVLPRP
jgi:hypothetical protein